MSSMRSPALLFGVLVLASCGHRDAPAALDGSALPRKLAAIRPIRRDVVRHVDVNAEVLAYEQATLFAEVAGYLHEIRVDKGDPVHGGDVLAEIAVPDLRARLSTLKASLSETESEVGAAQAEKDRVIADRTQSEAEALRANAELALQSSILERTRKLAKTEAVTPQDVDVATAKQAEAAGAAQVAKAKVAAMNAAVREADVRIAVAKAKTEVARANVREAETEVEFATIRAPFDAVVVERFVDRGAYIQKATSSQSSRIVTVARIDRLRVQFHVSETEVARVQKGERITLRTPARPGKSFTGTVMRSARALDDLKTMLTEAEFENPDDLLSPGMYGTVVLELERHPSAITVPPEVVARADSRAHVWVISDGAAHRTPIETGLDEGPFIEVLSGLKGDELIAKGAHGVVDGARVEPVLEKGSP